MRRAAALALVPLLAAGLTAGLTACGGDSSADSGARPELSAGKGFLPQPVMADMAAGYLTLRNNGGAADQLVGVTTALAERVTLHTTKGSRMTEVKQLAVPAKGTLALDRGGNHLMLEKLAHRPKVGEKVRLTLHFAKSDPITIKIPVEPTTYRPPRD